MDWLSRVWRETSTELAAGTGTKGPPAVGDSCLCEGEGEGKGFIDT